MEPVGMGVVLASLLNGLRHGVDIDHVAAIGDIVSSQADRRRSFWLASCYAIGHAAIVLVLGAVAVVIGARIPPAVDDVMSNVVGLSLIVLGTYVLYAAARRRGGGPIPSRWQLAGDFVRRLRGHLPHESVVIEHEHDHSHGPLHVHTHDDPGLQDGALAVATRRHVHTHRHVAVVPSDPLPTYGAVATFAIGLLHGIGAETPSQIALFVTAAGVGPLVLGSLVLGAFVVGMLVANAAIAGAFAWGARTGRKTSLLYRSLGVATALFSIAVGVSYLRS